MDALLTLEKKLPRIADQLKRRKQNPIDASVAILRPTELLLQLGVTVPDTVPIEPGRFYSYMEIFQIQDRILEDQPSARKLVASADRVPPAKDYKG